MPEEKPQQPPESQAMHMAELPVALAADGAGKVIFHAFGSAAGQILPVGVPSAPPPSKSFFESKGLVSFPREADVVPFRGRLTGKVQVLKRIVERWGLDRSQIRVLLDYESDDDVRQLFEGLLTLRGRDKGARCRLIFRIDEALMALFRDSDGVAEWLRIRRSSLTGLSPLDQMLRGDISDLMTVRILADQETGR